MARLPAARVHSTRFGAASMSAPRHSTAPSIGTPSSSVGGGEGGCAIKAGTQDAVVWAATHTGVALAPVLARGQVQ